MKTKELTQKLTSRKWRKKKFFSHDLLMIALVCTIRKKTLHIIPNNEFTLFSP